MVRRQIPPPRSPNGELHLREGVASDVGFVRQLSEEVFDQFGDYGSFLPTYLEHSSVFTIIAETRDATPLGFLMLALVTSTRTLPWEDDPPGETSDTSEALDAEVLAIAIDPKHQSHGHGGRLIDHALTCAMGWHDTIGVRSLQLNVAHTNRAARRFFQRAGFVEIDPFDGVYPRGQRSIRMARRV